MNVVPTLILAEISAVVQMFSPCSYHLCGLQCVLNAHTIIEIEQCNQFRIIYNLSYTFVAIRTIMSCIADAESLSD